MGREREGGEVFVSGERARERERELALEQIDLKGGGVCASVMAT